MIQREFIISLYLDERRKKANGLYPVKLNVYDSSIKKNKYYPTSFELKPEEFQSIWETTKPRSQYIETRLEMNSLVSNANEIAKTLHPFSFSQFEKKFFRKQGAGANVFYHYNLIIKKNKELQSIGNASMYELSRKSLKNYLDYIEHKNSEELLFIDITPEWLERYEKYMVFDLKRSRTTVSMYLRCLKAVFNYAIEEKEIPAEIYPFGKKKYLVPSSRNVKKALNSEELRRLFNAIPLSKEQEKAKDFWFFSYSCNGINIKDIAMLKWKHFDGERIIIPRAKTIKTAQNALPIVVYANDYIISILKKYGQGNLNKESFIFGIINSENSEQENFKKIKNFTRFINQNFKKLAVAEGITFNISTYWARHSFASQAIRSGASMEYVSEALNHNNLKTTKGYFAGFEDKIKKEFTKRIMDF